MPLLSAKRAPTSNSADGSPLAAARRNDSGPTVAAGMSSGIDFETPLEAPTGSCSASVAPVVSPSVGTIDAGTTAGLLALAAAFADFAGQRGHGLVALGQLQVRLGYRTAGDRQRRRATAALSPPQAHCSGRPDLRHRAGCRFATAARIVGRCIPLVRLAWGRFGRLAGSEEDRKVMRKAPGCAGTG